jgi:hypothetical protein
MQKIPEKCTRKAGNEGTAENGHIGQRTRTLESTKDVTLEVPLFAP